MSTKRTLAKCGQWQFDVPESEMPQGVRDALAAHGGPVEITDFSVVNLGPDGKRRFFTVDNRWFGPEGKKWNQPMVVEDPDFLMDLPAARTYCDSAGKPVDPKVKICGIVCKDSDGKVLRRLSISNAKKQDLSLSLDAKGRLTVTDKAGVVQEFALSVLVLANKNRIEGLVAGCRYIDSPDMAWDWNAQIPLLELEDLVRV